MHSVRILSEPHIREVAPSIAAIVDLVENTYRLAGNGEAQVPTKIGVHPRWPGSFCHAMPALVGDQALGMKWVTYFPGNQNRALPDSTGIIVLNDPGDGRPLAILEGMWITYARTAAAAAVFARHLANPNPRRLGLVGCGGLGRWSLLAMSETLPSLREVYVASKSVASREAFCDRMKSELSNLAFIAVDKPEDAVRGMDIVVSSISHAADQPIKTSYWAEGTLAIPLDVAGAWEGSAFSAADVFVSDGFEAFERSARRRQPAMELPSTPVELADVLLGKAGGRTHPKERIMAVTTGVASLDVVLAAQIYRRAAERNVGAMVSLS